jgi:hypothetical protein
MAMHRITVRDPDGQVRHWACNGEREGVFTRLPSEPAYRQLVGTGQAPRFRDAGHFRRYLHARFDVRGRMIDRWGWDDIRS